MAHYNTLNVTLSNSQLNKLKPGIESGTEVTVSISSNGVGDSNDENNLPNKLLLTKCTSFKASKSLWKKFNS